MEKRRPDPLGVLVRTIFNGDCPGSLADGELVERFANGEGESSERAFAALVERHGPMVLATCRGIVRDEHAAQDAFQVSFLVLARKAGSLGVHGSLGPWLHQVAYRTASCARAAVARRRFHEARAADLRDNGSIETRAADDMATSIHEEVGRLPERFRRPIVLCYFEGLTHEQAAGRLAWPVGTVRSRLARGRDRLRSSLVRRGIAPAIAAAVSWGEVRATLIPRALADSTVGASIQLAGASAGGLSPLAASLLTHVWRDMTMIRWAKAGAVLIAACGIATGGVMALRGAPPQIQAEGLPAKPPQEGVRSDRKQVELSLKRIGLALHNYRDVHGQFPPVDGRLSWRVAILPFLEHETKQAAQLPAMFRQDEPWDSPHNKALIERMPSQFARPGDKSGETPYRAIIVNRAAFRVPPGPGYDNLMDLGSQTLMVVEAAETVPWTKPDELSYETGGPLPRFSDSPGGFGASYLSGHVRFVNESKPEVLRKLLARVPDQPARPMMSPAVVTPSKDPESDQPPGLEAGPDPRRLSYARAEDLKEAVAILRSKLADDGQANIAALLTEARVRDSIRTAIRWQEAVLRKRIDAGGPGEDWRPILEGFRRSTKPIFEEIADRGLWPRGCWFTTFNTLRGADGVDTPYCGVHLHRAAQGTDSTEASLPVLDVAYGMAFPVPK